MDIGSKAFAEKMEQLSGGRFKIQVFPGGALGNALKVPETVKNGVAECGHTWMGYDWGKDPTTVLFGGYAGSFDSERMLHWLYQAGGVEMQRQFREETEGVISFPLGIRTAEAFLHSRKPVKTLDDLKGLKLRTAGAWLEMAKDLGAAPVTTAGGDVYPMLERGAIDATEWGTMYENISMGFHKIAIAEAKKLGIPLIGVVDTNHSPIGIDYVIPGNDDAAKAGALYARAVADAVLEGKANATSDVVQAVSAAGDEFVEVREGA